MDLQHILQPQAGPTRGRTPKRPSLSALRPNMGSQRHATNSSDALHLPGTTPPPHQILQSSRSVSEASRAHAFRGAFPPRYWLGSVPLGSVPLGSVPLGAHVNDDEDDDDDDDSEEEDEDDDSDEDDIDSLSDESSSENWTDDSQEAGMDEDAFSVMFTLGSDSSLDSESSPDYSLLETGASPHNSSFRTAPSSTFHSFPEPIDLTMEPSSPVEPAATTHAESSNKRGRQITPASASETSHAAKRRRTSQGPSSVRPSLPTKHIEEIDLLGDDDEDASIAAIVSKQREDQVKAQAPRPTEPTKLTTLQCTVCLDTPTDLTTTVCGHAFCRKCLIEWLISGEKEHPKRSNCPACRKSIKRTSKYDTIPLEIMVKPRSQVRLTPRAYPTDS